MSENNTNNGFDLLTCVEQFVLPSVCQSLPKAESESPSKLSTKSQSLSSSSWLDSLELNLTPRQRLEHTCVQVCLAEHIKTMQTMYRDPDDDLQVCLPMRSNGLPGLKLPSKLLQERILEGQIRIAALCRICYGDSSLEHIRARNDLSGSFAQQGLWQQAREVVDESHTALLRLCELPSARETYLAQLKRCKTTASIVFTTYKLLRTHAIQNFGHITLDFIRELIAEVGKLPLGASVDDSTSKTLGGLTMQADSSSHLDAVTKLVAALHTYLTTFASTNAGRSPSWGNMLGYLRHDCLAMRELWAIVEDGMLPQMRASLLLALQQCDRLNKRVAHATQFSQYLHRVHNTSRAIAGCGGLLKYLQQLKTEVSLQIDVAGKCVVDVSSSRATTSKLFHHPNDASNVTTVVYELPVSYEEILSYIVSEQDVDGVFLEMAHLLTLKGIVQIFSGQLSESEVTIREALRYLETQGLEMEAVACELYNTIAQLMIVKFRHAESAKRAQLKRAATAWLATEQGRRELREQMKAVRAHYMNRNMIVISAAESELKARNHLLKQKMKELQKFSSYDEHGEPSPPMKMVDAAYRYVVRSYDILESVSALSSNGQTTHPAVATACLAVASVLAMAEKHADAREWLSRALRSMEKQSPIPVRAIAYAQVQLSKVLQEGQFTDEAITVLARAVMFYSTSATDRLKYIYSQPSTNPVFRGKPYAPGTQPYEDVDQALTLGKQLLQLQVDRGNLWPAAEQSEVLSELAELAYGWDSPEAAEHRKLASDRFIAIKDLGRAVSHLRRCLETLECLHDKSDPRCLEIAKAIQGLNEARAAELDAQEHPESSPTNRSNAGKKGKSKVGHSFTERLRQAWNTNTTDLIRETMDLGQTTDPNPSQGGGQQSQPGPLLHGQVLVGTAPENQLVARYHTEHGLSGFNDDLDAFDINNTATAFQSGEDLSNKRLQRQPKQQSASANGASTGVLGNGSFKLDADLDLF